MGQILRSERHFIRCPAQSTDYRCCEKFPTVCGFKLGANGLDPCVNSEKMVLALQSLLFLLLSISLAAKEDSSAASHEVPILAKELGRASNESLLWGPYRPNLYFGVRPRLPKSLIMGLMWANVDEFQNIQESRYTFIVKRNLGSPRSYYVVVLPISITCDLLTFPEEFRHTCEQNEGMAGYGWDEYDIRKGGRQTIHDTGNAIDLTIDFIKVPGGGNGGNWGARVKGTPRADASPDQATTVVFYAAIEGLGTLELANEVDALGYKDDVKFTGSTVGLGDFTLDLTRGPESNAHPPRRHAAYDDKPLDRTMVAGLQVPADVLWNAKCLTHTFIFHLCTVFQRKVNIC